MYFKSFPTTIWNKKEMVDISRRAAILKKVKGDPYAFVPYTIQDGDTMEMIAYHYYGDAGLSWLVAIANDVIDPYCDFWKESNELEKFIANKYAEEAKKDLNLSYAPEDSQVITWTKNATITTNVKYYYSNENPNIQITPATQETYPSNEFIALRYYDYEVAKNEKKRNINLISDIYVNQIIDEMKTVLND